jgi:hypothetical protein
MADFNNNLFLFAGRELNRFNASIDHRPSAFPLAADFITSVDVATFLSPK